jgi:integrase
VIRSVELRRFEENSPTLAADAASVRDYTRNARSPNTTRAYRTDWHMFESWCSKEGRQSLPADAGALVAYVKHLVEERRQKVATIERKLVSISRAHELAGLSTPRGHILVKETMKGVRRALGTAQRKVQPLDAECIRALTEKMDPATLAGARDRLILILGFLGAFRRGEIVAMRVEHITPDPTGLIVFVPKSKTDQEGRGRWIGIPFAKDVSRCPARALSAWLELARIADGPIFRGLKNNRVGARALQGRDIARIIKRACRRSGLSPELFSGHSLRAGFVTAAYKAKKSDAAIASTTGHQSLKILHGYRRMATLFIDNAADGLL